MKFVYHFLRKRERRQHHALSPLWTPAYSMCSIIAPMTAVSPSRDAIDVDFGGVFEKVVHQHRTLRRNLNCACHVASQLRFGIDDLHGAPAQNEAWPNEHRITKFLRYRHGLFGAVADPFGGWRKPSLFSIAANSFRSSAVSMLSGVPRIGTPAASNPLARFNGVCPPN